MDMEMSYSESSRRPKSAHAQRQVMARLAEGECGVMAEFDHPFLTGEEHDIVVQVDTDSYT